VMADGPRLIKLPASVFAAPNKAGQAAQATDSARRKCWPDQKYIVKLPSAEEMEALRQRRAAAGVKIGSLPAHQPKAKKAVASKPAPVVVVSKEDQLSLKQSAEVKKGGASIKVPTAAAIEALKRRRAAAAEQAAASKKVRPAAVRTDGLVDHCALAREATVRAKQAAHLNALSPKPAANQGRKATEAEVFNGFLRNAPKANPEMEAKKAAEAAARAEEQTILRQRRAEAARASQSSGMSVNKLSAEQMEALKRRKEAAAKPTATKQVAAAPVTQQPVDAALKRRRAEAAKTNGGSGATVKKPTAEQMAALKQRRAAANKTAPAKKAPEGNMSTYEKLQARKVETKATTPKANGGLMTAAAKRQAEEALEGDLRSILSKKQKK